MGDNSKAGDNREAQRTAAASAVPQERHKCSCNRNVASFVRCMAPLKEKKEAGKPTGTRPPRCDGPTLPTKGASHQPGTTGTICRCWASGSIHPCNIGQKRSSR